MACGVYSTTLVLADARGVSDIAAVVCFSGVPAVAEIGGVAGGGVVMNDAGITMGSAGVAAEGNTAAAHSAIEGCAQPAVKDRAEIIRAS